MRAVVTGITGFVGSHLAEHLLANEHEVLGTGQSGKWKSDTPNQLVQRCNLLPWDLSEAPADHVLQTLNNFSPEVVFHFAAESIPSRCGGETPTEQAMGVNVDGTRRILDWLQTLTPTPKLIFASSSHVYGPVDPSDPYVREDSLLAPASAYGRTKLLGEQLVQSRMKLHGVPACITRGFHQIGPRQPSGRMISDWLDQLAQPNCTEIRVKSTQSYLDIVDVRDSIEAYALLAEDESATGVYNLGSGSISQSGQVLQAILELSNKTVTVIEESDAPRWNAIADISKLRALGWQPRHDYRMTVAQLVADACG